MSRALGDHFVKISNLGLISEPFVSESILLDEKNCYLVVASDGVSGYIDKINFQSSGM